MQVTLGHVVFSCLLDSFVILGSVQSFGSMFLLYATIVNHYILHEAFDKRDRALVAFSARGITRFGKHGECEDARVMYGPRPAWQIGVVRRWGMCSIWLVDTLLTVILTRSLVWL